MQHLKHVSQSFQEKNLNTILTSGLTSRGHQSQGPAVRFQTDHGVIVGLPFSCFGILSFQYYSMKIILKLQ